MSMQEWCLEPVVWMALSSYSCNVVYVHIVCLVDSLVPPLLPADRDLKPENILIDTDGYLKVCPCRAPLCCLWPA